MTLQVTPLHPHIGARAEGVDLRQPVSAELAKQIEAAMDRHAVLVFPGQDVDDDQQMDFAANFGPIETTRATVDVDKQRLAHPLMNDISNLDEKGEILAADDRRRMFNLGNRLWHSDSSFKATPAKYSMLHARSIPPEGGETGVRRHARGLGRAARENEGQGPGPRLRPFAHLQPGAAGIRGIQPGGAPPVRARAPAPGAPPRGIRDA